MVQKRLTTAAKKAVSKMPQKTLRRGDAVSFVISSLHFLYSLHFYEKYRRFVSHTVTPLMMPFLITTE